MSWTLGSRLNSATQNKGFHGSLGRSLRKKPCQEAAVQRLLGRAGSKPPYVIAVQAVPCGAALPAIIGAPLQARSVQRLSWLQCRRRGWAARQQHVRKCESAHGVSSTRASSHEEASTSEPDQEADGRPARDYNLEAFNVSTEFLDECREFLIYEENMDPNDEDALEAAVAELVEEMYAMALQDLPTAQAPLSSDDDEALDAETLATIDGRSQAIAGGENALEEGSRDSEGAASAAPEEEEEEGGPGLTEEEKALDLEILQLINERAQVIVDEQLAWEAELAAKGREIPDLETHGVAGWGIPEDLPLPKGVDPDAIRQMEYWEFEAASTANGVSLGWAPERGGLHPSVATLVMGLGGWRIGKKLDTNIQILAANIEAFWQQLFPDELAITSMDPRWKLVDSFDYNQRGLAWGKADPKPGEPGYPRMVLENRCYETTVFRNLHLELVLRQDGLQVLHCVMWPRVEYELPILGMDVVVAPGGDIQFVIADPSPVNAEHSLPPIYVDAVRLLRWQFAGGLSGNKGMPSWGAEIFSDEVVMARPKAGLETDAFVMYCVALARAHLLYAKHLEPLPESETTRRQAIDAAHRRYCECQRQNKQTRAVLSKSFEHLGQAGELFVERYMREVVFDHEFHYDTDEKLKEALRNENAGLGMPAGDLSAQGEVIDTTLSAMKAGLVEEALEEEKAKSNSDFFRDT